MRSLIRSAIKPMRKFVGLADQILVSGGNVLTIAICAHALPLPEQGKFTYIFASYMALLLLNVAGIFQAAAVRAPGQERGQYQISLARLQLLQAVFLSLLVCVAWFLAGNIFGWQATAVEAGLLFGFLVMQQLADFDRRSAYIFSGIKRAVISSAMFYPPRIIGLLTIAPNTVSEALLVLIISAFIPAALTLFAAARIRTDSTQSWAKAAKEHLTYSRLFIVGAPLGWLWSYIPLFMLGVMHGKEQAALLGSIRGISSVANILMEQVETKVVSDWAHLRHGAGELSLEAAACRVYKIGIAVWLFGMVVVLVFGKEVVTFALGSRYSPHWSLLVIAWLGYGVYFLARISAIMQRILGGNKIEFAGNSFGVAAAVLSGWMLIPSLGAAGAAWVYVAVAAAILGSQAYFVKKVEQQ